jgi:hypothetical protein
VGMREGWSRKKKVQNQRRSSIFLACPLRSAPSSGSEQKNDLHLKLIGESDRNCEGQDQTLIEAPNAIKESVLESRAIPTKEHGHQRERSKEHSSVDAICRNNLPKELRK